ncbi:helix-turn-helix domain-containing protein [Agromyces humatus]|uniref:Helix-turn-helix domain-containing protein n=1 Tax=Agromyces humatus TaxID=279573 RepID=A0ABN2L013_9MICO|nr:helix-turn-helix domain-containing protein [Agromyces humatus]
MDLLKAAREDGHATLTRAEVARLLRIDPRTVNEGIREGTIPSVRVGRRVLIPREPLLEMFSTSQQKPGDDR